MVLRKKTLSDLKNKMTLPGLRQCVYGQQTQQLLCFHIAPLSVGTLCPNQEALCAAHDAG